MTTRREERGLRSLPNIGPAMEKDLRLLGIDRPSCLKGKNSETLYKKLEKIYGQHVDRCVLYVFRAAVYFASTKNPDPALIPWWAWKDDHGKKK